MLRSHIPNLLTIARVLVVPIFLVVLMSDGGHDVSTRIWALVLFVAAAITDKIDGWLARKWDQITDLGKMLDPIADKLLMGSALVGLSLLGDLPWWVTIVIAVRELGITVMRFFLLKYVVLPASRGGKLKTVLQSVAISAFLLPLDHLWSVVTWFAWTTMILTVVVTLVTGADYVRTAVRVWRENRTVETS